MLGALAFTVVPAAVHAQSPDASQGAALSVAVAEVGDDGGRPVELALAKDELAPTAEQIDVTTLDGVELSGSAAESESQTFAAAPIGDPSPTRSDAGVFDASIQPAGNEDRYYFCADGGEYVSIAMDRTSGSLVSFLALYDPRGRLVARDDDSGGSRNAPIRTNLPAMTGTYRIVAQSFNRASTGSYRLTFAMSGCGQGPRPGSVTPQATWLSDRWGNQRSQWDFTSSDVVRVQVRVQNTGSTAVAAQLSFETESAWYCQIPPCPSNWAVRGTAGANVAPGTSVYYREFYYSQFQSNALHCRVRMTANGQTTTVDRHYWSTSRGERPREANAGGPVDHRAPLSCTLSAARTTAERAA